jgi:hypothetical protein
MQVQNIKSTYTVAVPARTLSSILDQYTIEHIDFISLDVEGYEADVLKGIDFSRHCPRYMLIEVHYREDIEAVIQRWYHPLAVLTINEVYQDIIYSRY